MSVREPAVAGMFYEAGEAQLRMQVESCFLGPGGPGSLPAVNPEGPRKIVGLVSPHAGFIYSGSVAAWAYYRLAEDGLPEIVVVIGPNHHSYHPAAALTGETAWRTPLGETPLDLEIAEQITRSYPTAGIMPAAHLREHCLEVQLPFLQYLAGDAGAELRIVPLLVGASAGRDAGTARQLGNAVAEAIEGRNAVVIASTDFTHYESGDAAQKKDSRAISNILALDEERLLGTVEMLDISMCGAMPTAVTIAACKKLGAVSARQLAYRNSGDVTGDYYEVVGYGAIEIFK